MKLNAYYKHTDYKTNRLFKLIKVVGYKYYFECGHWCTDSVFMDFKLINNNQLILDL